LATPPEAAPLPIRRTLDDLGPQRVAFDIPEKRTVEKKGGKRKGQPPNLGNLS
jgi:hypothetical protein